MDGLYFEMLAKELALLYPLENNFMHDVRMIKYDGSYLYFGKP
jgi:hypothetical protein